MAFQSCEMVLVRLLSISLHALCWAVPHVHAGPCVRVYALGSVRCCSSVPGPAVLGHAVAPGAGGLQHARVACHVASCLRAWEYEVRTKHVRCGGDGHGNERRAMRAETCKGGGHGGGNSGGGRVLVRDADAESEAVIQAHEVQEAASWHVACGTGAGWSNAEWR
ncbi:hypothetical protein B0H17DRAFT_1123784 [Mycena rosella]|uniref:Secreted protein n=1 Tax=Mycena rosella TaxID=1033263 RepID=A0AAD7H302_MYCRO|nr:hypothetical protein B0H17DRAFT_1123784 [Mycena rosella]